MSLNIRIGALLLLIGTVSSARANDDVIFYRCIDKSGGVTLQNMPCPKGVREEKKVMQAVQTVPAYSPTPSTPPVTHAQEAAKPAPDTPPPHNPAKKEAERRLPPPPLYQCTTRDKDSYLSEKEEASTRCVPMQVVGLDGRPQANGKACEVVHDQCARVPDGKACAAWEQREREAESHWRFAQPQDKELRKQQFDRIHRILTESTCGAP